MATWGEFKWGMRRFWERYVPVTGAAVSISIEPVTIVTIAHVIEGGSKMLEYDLGNVIKLSANFQNNSTDVDPGSVEVKIKTPIGTNESFTYGEDSEVVKSSTGDYFINYTPLYEGKYSFRWVATGTNASAAEASFLITESLFN